MVGCSGLDLRPPQARVAPAVRRARAYGRARKLGGSALLPPVWTGSSSSGSQQAC